MMIFWYTGAMITTFDKATLRSLEREAVELLAPLTAKYGIKCAFVGGKFHESQATLKFQMSLPSADGTSPEGERFKKFAHLYALRPEMLGKTFTSHGATYTVYGLKSGRATLYPVLCKRSDGRTFKFPVDTIVRLVPVD
jgi:hypothetical protein